MESSEGRVFQTEETPPIKTGRQEGAWPAQEMERSECGCRVVSKREVAGGEVGEGHRQTSDHQSLKTRTRVVDFILSAGDVNQGMA